VDVGGNQGKYSNESVPGISKRAIALVDNNTINTAFRSWRVILKRF
jgi:hypothetical protein